VLPAAAAAMDLALWWVGEPWSWADWAANFGLGAVTTMVVGMLLARRQGRIQEALADLELTEKVGYLTFSAGRLCEDCPPDRVRRALYDCRAGLALVPLARRSMQGEYLRTVARVLEVSADTLGSSLRSRVQWADADWAELAELVSELRSTAQARTRGRAADLGPWAAAVGAGADKLLRTAADPVPFEVFRAHFTAGPDRIRTELDWRGLADRVRRGDGSVALSVVRTDLAPYGLGPLRDYYAPWYADSAGAREARFDAPGAVPLRHADLAADASLLDGARRARIAELRAHYATQLGGGVTLILATYALGGSRRLVLDGNHRLTAIAQLVAAGCPARLVEFRLTAPMDPAILPDLVRYPRG
jgi:hypothetical protein